VEESVYIHPTALVESHQIGQGTRVWAFAHIMRGVVIGANCNIGDHCFLEARVRIGDNVTIKNGNMIWEGVTIEDGVFVGPNVLFTNDRFPRSPRLPQVHKRYASRGWLLPTQVRAGYRVSVISLRSPGDGPHETIDGVRLYQFPAPRNADGFLGYLWEYGCSMVAMSAISLLVFLREGFDVTHAHNPPDTFFLIAAFYRLFGKRFVYDHHDLAPEMYHARFRNSSSRLVHRVRHRVGWPIV